MLDLATIGERIATRRRELGLTQSELAEKLFVTHQAVSKWEQGKSLPAIDILLEMTKLFHVAIDVLLEDTDIEDNNYDRLFQTYPRHVVLSKFLTSNNMVDTLDHVFYRLSKQERLQVINHVIYHHSNLEVHHVWPYLNHSERTYLLGAILSGTLDYNIQSIRSQLTTEEQMLVQTKYQTGHYTYPLYTHSKRRPQ